jgi:hypothetical protein
MRLTLAKVVACQTCTYRSPCRQRLFFFVLRQARQVDPTYSLPVPVETVASKCLKVQLH